MNVKELNRLIIMWLGIIIGLYLFQRLTSVLTPFIISFGLAYLANPLVNRLEQKMSRTFAVSLVFFVFALGFVLILTLVVPALINQIISLFREMPRYYLWVQNNIFPYFEGIFDIDSLKNNEEAFKDALGKSLNVLGGLTSKIFSYIGSSTMAIVGFFVSLFLIPMLMFYIMRDWPKLMARFETLIPRGMAPQVLDFLRESNEMLSSFLRGQFTVMLILAFVYSVGLGLVGLKFSLLIGVTAGLISFVPYLGATTGIGAGLIVAWFQYGQHGDYMHIVLVGVVFAIGQALESFLLTPVLIGDKLGMHPIAVIFALMVGGALFGFFGILLALPVCAVLMVALREFYRRYTSSAFYLNHR